MVPIFRLEAQLQQTIVSLVAEKLGVALVPTSMSRLGLPDVAFVALEGAPTVAHFDGPAEPGKNAGVALLIGQNPTSPATGMATLTDAQAADLMGGRWYVNIHTAANRGGEIRGQVTK